MIRTLHGKLKHITISILFFTITNPIFADSLTTATTPSNNEISIKEINKIEEALSFVDDKSLVFVDLDNTIMMPTQTIGSDQWYYYMKNYYLKNGNSLERAKELVINDWQSVQLKTGVLPIENQTVTVIKQLQQKSMRVIGLTARSKLRERTIEQVASIGVDFTINNQFNFTELKDTGGAVVRNGIIMGGGIEDKGLVMQSFLDMAGLNKKDISKIILIDDKHDNISSLAKAAKQLQIKYIGLRYGAADKFVKNFSKDIADKQFTVLKKCNRLISDKIAHGLKTITTCAQFIKS